MAHVAKMKNENKSCHSQNKKKALTIDVLTIAINSNVLETIVTIFPIDLPRMVYLFFFFFEHSPNTLH